MSSILMVTTKRRVAGSSPAGCISFSAFRVLSLHSGIEKPDRKLPTGHKAINSLSRSDIKLTLAELESATGALATVLLGFLDTRVAGQEAIAAQHGA